MRSVDYDEMGLAQAYDKGYDDRCVEEPLDLKTEYDRGFKDGKEVRADEEYAEGFAEGMTEGRKLHPYEIQEVSLDGSCPKCATTLKRATVCDDKHDEMVDIAEYCPNCKYEREY